MLKMMGLVTIKGGNKGGAFIEKIDINMLTNIIDLMLQFEITNWKEIIEVRLAIEPFISKMSAKNHIKEDLDALIKILDENESVFHDQKNVLF